MREFFYRHSRGVTRVVVGKGLRPEDYLAGRRAVYVVDGGAGVAVEGALVLSGGEEVKGLETLTKIYAFLSERGVDRGSALVAVGGGAVLDVATFAAGTYMRGIGLVLVPTTLLAMVDAAIGGKGAVDWGPIKNLVGVFYQPEAVLCDIGFAAGLPDRVYRAAFAELVKYGVVLDRGFFSWLSENAEALLRRDEGALEQAVYRGASIKASVVEIDEFETRGIRQVLNFGHTVGHAIERISGLLHGEAVAVGMAVEGEIAAERGLMSGEGLRAVKDLLARLGLPTSACLTEAQVAEAKKLVAFDKKRRGDVVLMPMPVGLGKWVLEEVSVREVEEALEGLRCTA
ncbi:MAG: 3-dehydroquinate synthase family protein [Thermoproteus sp. AZ2]|uniref:3-dehydroquinate synthase family protein n=1 Tax=Thermoproteus sp. AZ2 TaxID=1609232 RepID=A0ACC6V0L9_9CREN|nr:MAG: 3-dehydroquinate synthase [Thermoproteus sp. AZ2]